MKKLNNTTAQNSYSYSKLINILLVPISLHIQKGCCQGWFMERLQREKKKKKKIEILSFLCPVVSCTAQRSTTPASDRKDWGWVRSKQLHHQSAAKAGAANCCTSPCAAISDCSSDSPHQPPAPSHLGEVSHHTAKAELGVKKMWKKLVGRSLWFWRDYSCCLNNSSLLIWHIHRVRV